MTPPRRLFSAASGMIEAVVEPATTNLGVTEDGALEAAEIAAAPAFLRPGTRAFLRISISAISRSTRSSCRPPA